MVRMVRVEVYIKPRQEALLKYLSQTGGVSESELIRQAIDQQMSTGQARLLPPDPVAWEEAYQFMLDLLARGPVKDEARTWTCEELYGERTTRYERDSG